VADFYKRDPEGDIDRIYAQLLKDAPGVKQAEAKLAQAKAQSRSGRVEFALLRSGGRDRWGRYAPGCESGKQCHRRPSLMAVRSLTEIWVDANFKETQLSRLRIGQMADLDVDMYGRREHFKGRISGFTMGTGSTLALLPSENATGNFVKVVQRLPVRLELVDYDPYKTPLFIGLSVTPSVHVNEEPTGPDAGKGCSHICRRRLQSRGIGHRAPDAAMTSVALQLPLARRSVSPCGRGGGS